MTKPAAPSAASSPLVELSLEILELVERLLDVEALLTLSATSRVLHDGLRALTEARCKRECFTTYLYPTIASYRMEAAVPRTWMQLYLAFSTLRGLRWSVCRSEGTSSSLRTLKSDTQEYESDPTTTFLLRSGGHYWFSVLQARIAEASLGGEPSNPTPSPNSNGAPNTEGNAVEPLQAEALAFLHSPQQITMGKWEKIRATGKGPCPRRNHSMTCLSTAIFPRELMIQAPPISSGAKGSAGRWIDVKPAHDLETGDEEGQMSVRRVVIFGGQSEGIPFEPFDDLYLLCVENTDANCTRKSLAAWVPLNVTGQAPSPRCGHDATLLSPKLLMISGGSSGVTPIPTLDIFLLHIEGCAEFRWSTPSTSSKIPAGRSLHDVYRVSESEVFIFGGRQIRQSNGLLDVHRVQITTTTDELNDTQYTVEWSSPRLSGSLPCSRRGHSTNSIGPHLLLFGGQDEATGQLENDVYVLDIAHQRWRHLDVPGDAPCPRRGFKNQFFGTSLVVSSGFVRSTQAGKVDHQLPDSDVHVLSLV